MYSNTTINSLVYTLMSMMRPAFSLQISPPRPARAPLAAPRAARRRAELENCRFDRSSAMRIRKAGRYSCTGRLHARAAPACGGAAARRTDTRSVSVTSQTWPLGAEPPPPGTHQVLVAACCTGAEARALSPHGIFKRDQLSESTDVAGATAANAHVKCEYSCICATR